MSVDVGTDGVVATLCIVCVAVWLVNSRPKRYGAMYAMMVSAEIARNVHRSNRRSKIESARNEFKFSSVIRVNGIS